MLTQFPAAAILLNVALASQSSPAGVTGVVTPAEGPGSDHLVQPADRGAVAGVPERLELVVPRLAEQLVDLDRRGWCRPART